MKTFLEAKIGTREGSEQEVIDNEDAQKFIQGLQELKK